MVSGNLISRRPGVVGLVPAAVEDGTVAVPRARQDVLQMSKCSTGGGNAQYFVTKIYTGNSC